VSDQFESWLVAMLTSSKESAATIAYSSLANFAAMALPTPREALVPHDDA
jgi:hypothetical protein